jgi:hypothetical protein
VVSVLVLVVVVALAAGGAAAKPSLKAPKAGTWKLIAAENTPGGVKVLGGVVGSFTVVGETVKNFHLTFVEKGESAGCAGGEDFEGKGEEKKATIKFAPEASAPIVKTTSGYLIAVGAGQGVQGADVPVTPPVGVGNLGTIYATLVPRRKKESRRGSITWGECSVAFIAKPAG